MTQLINIITNTVHPHIGADIFFTVQISERVVNMLLKSYYEF